MVNDFKELQLVFLSNLLINTKIKNTYIVGILSLTLTKEHVEIKLSLINTLLNLRKSY